MYMDIMETARLKRIKEVRMEITAGTEVLVVAYKSKILSSLSASILHVYLFLSRVSFNWEKHVQKVYLTLEQPNILVPSLLNNAPPVHDIIYTPTSGFCF